MKSTSPAFMTSSLLRNLRAMEPARAPAVRGLKLKEPVIQTHRLEAIHWRHVCVRGLFTDNTPGVQPGKPNPECASAVLDRPIGVQEQSPRRNVDEGPRARSLGERKISRTEPRPRRVHDPCWIVRQEFRYETQVGHRKVSLGFPGFSPVNTIIGGS